jgi:hypothetical protein
MKILGYSERGLVNSLFYEIKYSEKSVLLLSRFLSLIDFQSGKNNFRLENNLILFLEQSFSDFGEADAVLLFKEDGLKKSIFFEAKVKTSLKKIWSIDEEFNAFKNGVKSKVSSSNLFMQLYFKQALMTALQKDDLSLLQNEGIAFPGWSSKRIRSLGKNEVVKRAVEALKSHSESAHYIAIVPDETQKVALFFKQKLCKYQLASVEYWNTVNWGLITWLEIELFCKEHCLRETLEVFEHNRGQIY